MNLEVVKNYIASGGEAQMMLSTGDEWYLGLCRPAFIAADGEKFCKLMRLAMTHVIKTNKYTLYVRIAKDTFFEQVIACSVDENGNKSFETYDMDKFTVVLEPNLKALGETTGIYYSLLEPAPDLGERGLKNLKNYLRNIKYTPVVLESGKKKTGFERFLDA